MVENTEEKQNVKVNKKKSRKWLVIVLTVVIVVQLIILAFIYRQDIEGYFLPAPPVINAKIFEHKELFKTK